ncbi:DUF2922 family protein [Enterococcus mediterraneensis]|uniref:DUF2922 family protein n=1 Tax=Enterococcus mediterraneensis TaxID=2364791 RepID=UPI000F0496C5|nr:DUF2922 family protein [Enterococcus mediterraneensis]
MKKLHLIFLDEECRPHTFVPVVCRQDLKEEEIHEIMTDITKLSLFEKEGIRCFRYMEGAKYVSTVEYPLFSNDV